MFKVTVMNSTDERVEPSIYGRKTGVTFVFGTTWLTETIYKVRPGETWVKTPNDQWTAAEFPINGDPDNIKTYLSIVEIPSEPEPVGHYNPNDKLVHEVDGVIVAEYHRWLP